MSLGHDIKIGQLDQRVTIRTLTASSNNYGEETYSTNADTTVFAKVEYMGMDREATGIQEVVYDKIQVTFRYYSTLSFTERDRIIWDSNTYDIVNIAKLGRNRFYQVTATRVH